MKKIKKENCSKVTNKLYEKKYEFLTDSFSTQMWRNKEIFLLYRAQVCVVLVNELYLSFRKMKEIKLF